MNYAEVYRWVSDCHLLLVRKKKKQRSHAELVGRLQGAKSQLQPHLAATEARMPSLVSATMLLLVTLKVAADVVRHPSNWHRMGLGPMCQS